MPFALYPYDHACSPNWSRRGLGLTRDTYGRLLLNAGTFAALVQPRRVGLLFDRTAGVIDIQANQNDVWHALRVCSTCRASHSHRISAKGFCTYFGLHFYLGQRYRGEMRDGFLRVPLLGDWPLSAWQERASITPTAAASAALPSVDVLSAPRRPGGAANTENGRGGMTIVDCGAGRVIERVYDQ